MSEEPEKDGSLFPERVCDRLRAARMKSGLDLSDIATRTRVPLRHLQAIEGGDYNKLPSITYSVGFVKAFARAVGEDADVLAGNLRSELGETTMLERAQPVMLDEDGPGPVPSSRLAWIAGLLLLLVAGGYAVIRSYQQQVPDAVVAAQDEEADAENAGVAATNPPVSAAPDAKGTVLITARDAVWLRVYDASDKVLFEKEMARGESWPVTADANNPMVRTGRADLLLVTVGGKEVPPLGPPERTIKDVGVSAAALIARPPVLSPAAPVQPSAASGAAAATAPVNR